MNKPQNKPNRRSIRLKEYDYSQAGAYFVTIVVHHRIPLFGKIENEIIYPIPAGLMINRIWMELPDRFPSIELDDYCLMPNHFHGIVVIKPLSIIETKNLTAQSDSLPNSRAATRAAPALGSLIGVFKSISTHEYIKDVRNNDWSPFNKILWQRNYYEHIIRNEDELNQIRQYVMDNPINWTVDSENPENRSTLN